MPRPVLHRDRGHGFNADEVCALLGRQGELGLGRSIEWLHSLETALTDACIEAGLDVVLRPMLVADANAFIGAGVPPAVTSVSVSVLAADHPLLGTHRNVAHVAFTHGGTAIGLQGALERDAVPVDPVGEAWFRSRVAGGHTIAVAAFDGSGEMVGVGSAQPVVDPALGFSAAELTGIAVLPSHRRRGIAASITATLGAACAAMGVRTVLLSAQDDDVARVYERIGFRRVAVVGEATSL